MSDGTNAERSARPATLVVGRIVPPGEESRYQEWHHRIDIAVRAVPGFVASELHTPIEGIQEGWVHVLRFESSAQLRGWLDSPERIALVREAAQAFGEDVHQQVLTARDANLPVTVALSHKVRAGQEEAYHAWQAGIDGAAARFPGFRGSERHDPIPGVQDEYVVVFRFASLENLHAWRESDERRRWMESRDTFIEATREQRITGGFDGWFGGDGGASGQVPSRWKQALVVLLGLYPTSMVLGHFLFPRIPGWPDPLARLAAFVVSIAMLSWVVMPIVTWTLGTWLDPVRGARPLVSIAGVIGIAVVCAAFVALFSISFG